MGFDFFAGPVYMSGETAFISDFHRITNDLTTFPTHQVRRFLALFIVMIIHHALMSANFTLPVFSEAIDLI